MAAETIYTVGEAIKAIRRAVEVRMVPRFGNNGTSVKISKAEAKWFLDNYDEEDTAESIGMFGNSLGILFGDGTLIIG